MTGVRFRPGQKPDCPKLGELVRLSSGGVVDFLYHDIRPGSSAAETVARSLEQDVYPVTYRNAVVAELCGDIAGMALSYPSSFQGVNPSTASLLPPERLAHMHDFYSARVEGSWYIDALAVFGPFRGQGIGRLLVELSQERAVKQGYQAVSLIVFADNEPAFSLYRSLGFRVVRHVRLEGNEFIPHSEGCLLLVHPLTPDAGDQG